MTDITVLTSITDGMDELSDDQARGDETFVAYVSKPVSSNLWTIKDPLQETPSNRRNFRIPKMRPHLYCDTAYSLWIDGNLNLRRSATEIIGEWLAKHDMAVFKHPERSCIYEEAAECVRQGLDDTDAINAQAARYRASGYPAGDGLAECNVIARRHTAEVETFNEAWWKAYSEGSVRDQLSFMYALKNSGLAVNWIPKSVRAGHPDFYGRPHLKTRQEPRP